MLPYDPRDYPIHTDGNRPESADLMANILLDFICDWAKSGGGTFLRL